MADLLDLVDERVNNVYPRYELKVFLAKAVGGRVRQAHEHGKNYDQSTDRHGMATLRPAKILRIRCPSDEAERAFDHLIDDVVDECDKLPAQRLFVGSHERDVNP